jgi:hypothetical protein
LAPVLEADEAFFRGDSDQLGPFALPVAELHADSGHLPWFKLDDAGQRLIAFAHRFGSYDWTNDPRRDQQESLLRALAVGALDDPVDGDYEFLWHCLFAVVRADRFTEGLVASNLLALTRIANELRRRLLDQREASI